MYYSTFFFNFLGQQHLTILCLCAGGGDTGVLAGRDLAGLRPEEPSSQDLEPSSVSTTQYDNVQYITVLPYFNRTINNVSDP